MNHYIFDVKYVIGLPALAALFFWVQSLGDKKRKSDGKET
jgi:hypothetical protein